MTHSPHPAASNERRENEKPESALQGPKERQAQKGRRALRVQRAPKERRVLRVRRALKAQQVRTEWLVQMARQVLTALQVPTGTSARFHPRGTA